MSHRIKRPIHPINSSEITYLYGVITGLLPREDYIRSKFENILQCTVIPIENDNPAIKCTCGDNECKGGASIYEKINTISWYDSIGAQYHMELNKETAEKMIEKLKLIK